ncbi:MAG: response regulator transcription factor [Candidatus Omnitrophota bacterium]|jgi:DNA-binding response OmpR family regulator
MPKETILVIEDEKNIAELVKVNLEQAGYAVRTVLRGDTGLEEARKTPPDLIVLDLMLPGLDGLEICRILKGQEATSHVPVIMLTAKTEETDQIVGLELGADDYVTKPFSPRQLVARVKAVLRRGREKKPADKIYRIGALEFDTAKYIVSLKGKKITMSSKEFELLRALLEAGGRVLSRDFLLENVWGYDRSVEIETRTIDMHIGQLRKKLKQEGARIVTVKNVGYRLDAESES